MLVVDLLGILLTAFYDLVLMILATIFCRYTPLLRLTNLDFAPAKTISEVFKADLIFTYAFTRSSSFHSP